MKILFLGTPAFAVPSLLVLLDNGYAVTHVVTAPDKPAGRGLQLQPSAIKVAALKRGVTVWQPPSLRDEAFLQSVGEQAFDVAVVVAFRMMPEVLWSMPRMGTINLHGSLLPDYRGAAPINWAIINGEKMTGCTTFFLKHEIDTGDVIDTCEIPIADDANAGQLHDSMMYIGAELVLKSIKKISKGGVEVRPQVLSATAHKAPKLDNLVMLLDFNDSALAVCNRVRGLSPYPAAYFILFDKKCKVFAAVALSETSDKPIGTLICDNKSVLKIVCASGCLQVLELQLEGKKKMSVVDFLLGNKAMFG